MDSINIIQEMGIKDLEYVVLKAKEEMILGDKVFEPGEPVLYFKNIQIALLTEDTRVIAAQGGFLNQPRVVWEDRNNTIFQFSNGTLNPISLNLLLEANVLRREGTSVPYSQFISKDYVKVDKVQGIATFTLKYNIDKDKKRFYYTYDYDNLQKPLIVVSEESDKNGTIVVVKLPDSWDKIDEYDGGIMVDYYFVPKKDPIIYSMDRERKSNLYTLEATFYLKDENDGLLHTGILEMPKVYIMSNINLRMGERADPTVGTFRIMAMPDNYDNYDSMVWRMMYLEDDIYGI